MRHSLPAVAIVSVLVLGGCGIPDDSGITAVGPGPSTGITSGDDGTDAPATRTTSSDRAQFIDNYLAAAAGDYDTAVDRVKEFMAPGAAATFKPVNIPRVIRLTADPLVTPGPEVVVSYELIGTLGKDGVLEPSAEPVAGEYEITLATASDGITLYVADAPEFLLLSDVALDEEYDQRTIYFWNTEHTGLVPDVRYLWHDVPVEQQPTVILGWLIGGPAPWLRSTVEVLPEGTVLNGKVPAINNQKMLINLSVQAVPTEDSVQALDRLRRQLQWSLRPLLPEFLDLTIGHQETMHYSTTDYLTSNPAFRLEREPEGFVVYGGKIVRLSGQEHSVEAIPAVPPSANKGIRTAALSRSATHTFAALVGGSGDDETLRVGSTPLGGDATLRPVTGLPRGLGQVLWAITPEETTEGAVGLIVAAGRLYSFPSEGGRATPVPWPGGTGRIDAVSVAPDGHRAAFVVDGRLYRAALAVSGDGVALSDPELLRPPLAPVTAVDFSSEGWLTVAGTRKDKRVSILDVTIDGALQDARLPDIGKDRVTYLAAYPANPVNPQSGRDHSGSVSYTTSEAAWDVLSSSIKITATNLAVPPGDQPEGAVPSAPFFLE